MSTDTLVVISPTGVDVELAIAGPGSRAYAFIIDWHIRLLIAVCWFAGASYLIGKFASSGTKSSTTLIVFASAPAAVIYVLYHPLVELVMRGRTPGKWLAGVRIVNLQGGTPSTLAVLVRNAFRLIDSLPALYAVGLCTTLINAQRARFGDLAAGTLLVHDGSSESKALKQLGSLTLNPTLDADTVALGNDLLLRWKELQPTTRRRLARELLATIASTTGSDHAPVTVDSLDDRTLQQQLRNALAGGSK
jgi:uncharacterized RDD family membrane protein YckC